MKMKKIFNKQIIIPFFTVIGTIAIFEWIVFPGLTTADTFVNIFALIIGFFSLLNVFYSLQFDKLCDEFFPNEKIEAEGETELDYVPKKRTVVKAKKSVKNVKQTNNGKL